MFGLYDMLIMRIFVWFIVRLCLLRVVWVLCMIK